MPLNYSQSRHNISLYSSIEQVPVHYNQTALLKIHKNREAYENSPGQRRRVSSRTAALESNDLNMLQKSYSSLNSFDSIYQYMLVTSVAYILENISGLCHYAVSDFWVLLHQCDNLSIL